MLLTQWALEKTPLSMNIVQPPQSPCLGKNGSSNTSQRQHPQINAVKAWIGVQTEVMWWKPQTCRLIKMFTCRNSMSVLWLLRTFLDPHQIHIFYPIMLEMTWLNVTLPLQTGQKAVQQGSETLCLAVVSPYTLPALVCRGTATICRLLEEKWVQLSVSPHSPIMRMDYSSLWLSNAACKSMLCTHAVAW